MFTCSQQHSFLNENVEVPQEIGCHLMSVVAAFFLVFFCNPYAGLMKIESGSSIELSKLHCFTRQDQCFEHPFVAHTQCLEKVLLGVVNYGRATFC